MNLQMILPMVILFVVFYFVLLRPQKKQQKKTREMQANLKRGDKIVTIGGLHGKIDAVDEDQVVIRCNDGSKLTYDRAAIRNITEAKPVPNSDPQPTEEKK